MQHATIPPSTRHAGRIVGSLILVQMVGSPVVNFVLERPLSGFLLAAAGHVQELGLAVVASLIVEAINVAIAITIFQVARHRTPVLSLWLLVLSGVVLALAVIENAAVLSMLSLSQSYAAATPAARTQLEAIRGIVAEARNWPHFLARMFDGLTLLAFYAVLHRAALVPRALALLGLVAAALQITGIGVTLFGGDVIFPMLLPLGLSQLTLAIWLLAKGVRLPQNGRTEHVHATVLVPD